jgi:sarcosine oxidase subunit gamma
VAEHGNNIVSIERIGNPSIVSLKVSRKAHFKSQLASPSSVADGDPRSLWIGPDHWLLISNSMKSDSIISNCKEWLGQTLYNAVDYSAALSVLRICGVNAGELLATGCGLDFRPEKFPIGMCCRTRLAQIAAVIVRETAEQFDVYIDRSYGTYLLDWLNEASSISVQ